MRPRSSRKRAPTASRTFWRTATSGPRSGRDTPRVSSSRVSSHQRSRAASTSTATTSTRREVHCLYYFNYNFYTSLAAVKAVGGGNIPSGDISARELETQYNIKYFPIDDKSLYACYYKHFIKHLDNGEKRKLGVMEYGVVRNNWYRVTIADIAGLGSGIINIEPTRPVEEDDILLTDYYVSPWQFRPDDTVLSQPRKK